MRLVFSFAPQPFYPKGKGSGTYWMGGLVVHRVGLDVLGMRKISCPYRKSNHDSSVVMLPAWLILWPRYRSLMQFVPSALALSATVFFIRVKVTVKLWTVPHNLQAPDTHLAVTDQARKLDQPVLARVAVSNRGTRVWPSRTASLSCAELTPVILYAITDYCQDRKVAFDCTIAFQTVVRRGSSGGTPSYLGIIQFFIYNSILNMLIALLELIKHIWMHLYFDKLLHNINTLIKYNYIWFASTCFDVNTSSSGSLLCLAKIVELDKMELLKYKI